MQQSNSGPAPGPVHPDQLAAVAKNSEAALENQHLQIPFFETRYRLGPTTVCGPTGERPTETICDLLVNYVLNFPAVLPKTDRLVSFRELEGAGPLVVSFANNTNKTIMTTFAGKRPLLEAAAGDLGGRPRNHACGFDLSLKFQALPHIPLYLQFNDAEAPFPAQCSLLLEASIEAFLDMRSIFTLGTFLCGQLAARGYD